MTVLTYISLMDGFDDGQEGRSLFLLEAALSAEKHSLYIQLQQDSSFWFREINSKHTADDTVTQRERISVTQKYVSAVFVIVYKYIDVFLFMIRGRNLSRSGMDCILSISSMSW